MVFINHVLNTHRPIYVDAKQLKQVQ